MGKSIWTRDISLTAKLPSGVGAVVSGGIVGGSLLCLAAIAGMFAIGKNWVPSLDFVMVGAAGGLGAIGILAGVFVRRRMFAGVPLAFIFSSAVALLSAVSLFFGLTFSGGNLLAIFGPAGFLWGSCSMFTALCKREIYMFLRGEIVPPRQMSLGKRAIRREPSEISSEAPEAKRRTSEG